MSDDPRRTKAEEARQLWADMRGLVEHEDTLVDHRLRWLFTFNGFLFAAMGLSLSAEGGLLTSDCRDPERCGQMLQLLAGLRYAITGAGALSAVASLFGVMAAQSAVRAVRSDYVKACAARGLPAGPFSPIGRLRADMWGVNIATWLPVIVAAVWVALAIWSWRLQADMAIGAGVATIVLLLVLIFWRTTAADTVNDVRDVE
jgi:hypothetical protein